MGRDGPSSRMDEDEDSDAFRPLLPLASDLRADRLGNLSDIGDFGWKS